MSGRPLDVLEETLDETVTVTLKDGETFQGVLAGYDQHMNLVLDPAPPAEGEEAPPEEAVSPAETVEDTTVIRGDNVVSIQT